MSELKISPRFAITVTNAGNDKKIKEAFEQAGVSVVFTCHGQGTAPSAIMDLFGLSGREKLITAGFVDRSETPRLFKTLDEKMSFSQKGHGIAFTMSPICMQKCMMSVINKETPKGDESKMNEQTSYIAILAAVAGGFSEEVVEAARSAGARGGTIMKGMRDCNHEVSKTLGVPLVEEQDFVLILVPKDTKNAVMDAITAKCGINTEAHGIVSAFPLDEVFGL